MLVNYILNNDFKLNGSMDSVIVVVKPVFVAKPAFAPAWSKRISQKNSENLDHYTALDLY